MKTSITSIRDVVNKGLCTRCGACAPLCPEKNISFSQPWNGNLPQFAKTNCQSCSSPCLIGCSGYEVNFPSLNNFLFNNPKPNPFIGFTNQAFVGHSNNQTIRYRGASGGTITQILISLLERKQIDGAIICRMKKDQPYLAEPFIATTHEEILQGAQSKYAIVPVNSILEDSSKFNGKLAFVGLPCHVHSIRILQMQNSPLTKSIEIVIGSYCGNTLMLESVKMFLKQHGIKDMNLIKSLEYRAGGWPGYIRIVLKTGLEIKLKKFYANYLIPFFMMDRCFVCIDLTNELADISCGDAWSPVYEEHGQGWSLIVPRSKQGSEIIKNLSQSNQLYLQEISLEEAMKMHAHMLDFKKRGSFIRMKWKNILFQSIPVYGIEPIKIPFSRYRFEFLLDSIFLICKNPVSRIILQFIPVSLFARYFDDFRKYWKTKTLKAKRNQLFTTSFKYD